MTEPRASGSNNLNKRVKIVLGKGQHLCPINPSTPRVNLGRPYSTEVLYLGLLVVKPIVPLRLSRSSFKVSYGFYEETRTSLVQKAIRVIYSEGYVDVIEEDLKEMYPIFKWTNHLETIWVILLLLQKARMDEGATRAIMD